MCDEKYPCKVELPKGLKDTKLRCIFGFSHCYWKAIESPEPEGDCEYLGKVGEYNISQYPPVPNTNQVNVLWIQKDDGEGMSLDLDELWKDF